MANMNDYLSWRGDLTLGERPFNDVDALVLACLSYLDLRGLVPGEDATGVTGPSPTRPSPSTASARPSRASSPVMASRGRRRT